MVQVAIFKCNGNAVSPFNTLFDSSQLAATPEYNGQADFTHHTPAVDRESRQVRGFEI